MYYNKYMRNLLFFTIYIIFFALLSSLIFTLLYMQFDEQPMLALNKAIKYGAIILCAIFIIPTIKAKNLYNKKLLGYLESRKKFLLNVSKGFLISLLLSSPLLFIFINFDIRNINFNLILFDQLFLYTILLTLFISLIISTIEESFFRGIMIQNNNNNIVTFIIIMLSSLIYSLFHFIKIPLIIDDNIFWNTGIKELLNVFANFHNIVSLDAAITLFVFGVLLGIIRNNYKTISYCIGIHAGFIFIIKIFRQNSSVNFDSYYNYLISGYDHFTGYLSAIWITIILLIYIIYLCKKNNLFK